MPNTPVVDSLLENEKYPYQKPKLEQHGYLAVTGSAGVIIPIGVIPVQDQELS